MLRSGQHFRFDTLFRDDSVGTAEKFDGILLYQIGELSCVSGYSVSPHKQWCHEISFVISGEGIFTTGNNTQLLMEGGVQFSPAGTVHSIKTKSSDLRYGYVGFAFDGNTDDKDILRLKNFFDNAENFFAGNCNEFFGMFFGALDELHNQSEDSHRMASMYLQQMLITVYRILSCQKHDSYFKSAPTDSMSRAVYLAFEYIDKHIYDKISVEDLSKAIGYNYSYLSSAFKKNIGITVNRYITDRKIQKSIELMNFENLSFTDIAEKLSYSSIQVFNKAFRRVTGYSPSTFMKMRTNNDVSGVNENEKA